LVADTIAATGPAYVLVEGPVDLNDRLDELLLGHELPIAVFSSYRGDDRRHLSWAPFCAYSPEWVALTAGSAAGAEVRFVDLPAWHPAFAARTNRYADAEQRSADVVDRLCARFAVDNVDTLWDHLFEIAPPEGLAERLVAYFDLVRDEAEAGPEDRAREEYMAGWVRAAVAAAGDRPVVVVTGGFHRPALIRLSDAPSDGFPEVPGFPDGATGGSYLVPYSFQRLDAFDGYQSGMPSPEYYQQLWERGPNGAARHLTEVVTRRLRDQRQPVSTADLIAARVGAEGLATVRGHAYPARADILDGLAGALIKEALDGRLPWATRGTLQPGTHPVIVELVAALRGSRIGRLAEGTPLPPLCHSVDADLERHGLRVPSEPELDLTRLADRDRSRLLHRLRVLGVPGFERLHGPSAGVDPVLDERWRLTAHEHRLPALIEAGAYGATLEDAARAALRERVVSATGNVAVLGGVLFDAALCGIVDLEGETLREIEAAIRQVPHLGPLGGVLATVLALWRHDRLLGSAHSPQLGAVIVASVTRALWLAEGIRGATVPADPPRIAALVAVRDALLHAGEALDLDRAWALAVTGRLAADRDVPPDLRGAAFGLAWSVGADPGDPLLAVRGAFTPSTAGDWLAGLFALAREEVLRADGIIDLLDELLDGLGETDFLVALPPLRQAFAWFPPRERETIAQHLLTRRGLDEVSARSLLRMPATADLVIAGRTLDERVDAALIREGLVTTT
jgi:hypothetical protein